MTAITLTDLNNAKSDVDHIANIANSSSLTATDRLGNTKRTVAGITASVDAELALKLDDATSEINVKLAAAEASAASAQSYLVAYRATSYGALSSDPTLDPNGGTPTTGDEYFNTTSNLLKRFNGATWQASDINTANLAAPTGAALVGANAYQTQDGINLERQSVVKYGGVNNGVTDITAALNNALNTGKNVFIPAGPWAINGTVNVGEGQKIYCVGGLQDAASKNNAANDVRNFGTVFVMGASGKFVLAANAYVGSCVIYYPTQNYNIVADGGQPDGLSAFVVFPPTFTVTATYGAPTIEDIIYIGGTTVVYSPITSNCEKLRVKNVIGCCTGKAFDIEKSTDVLYFDNIHLNPNTVLREISNRGGSFGNFLTKVAKNFDMFKFSDCDGVNLTNVFAYACRNFIDTANLGVGIVGVNCNADVCHTYLNLTGAGKNFGIQFSNSWSTPIVYSPVIAGAVSALTPALVRFNGSATGHHVNLSNVNTSGGAVALVAGTAPIAHVYQADVVGGADNNVIMATNCRHLNVASGLSSGMDLTKRFGTTLNLLQAKNVTMNSQSWGESENTFVDGWGDSRGLLWKRTNVTSLESAGWTIGLDANITAGGSVSATTPYVSRIAYTHPVYVSATYGTAVILENILVTIDILSAAGVYESTLYTGSLLNTSRKTDIKIPVVGVESNRVLRVTLTNNNAGAVVFGYFVGFASNTQFPKLAPCPYGDKAGAQVQPNDADYTTRRVKNSSIFYYGALTAIRAVSLNVTNPGIGDTVTVTRNSTSTGAFNLNVNDGGALRVALTAGTWAQLMYTGSTWLMISKGTI